MCGDALFYSNRKVESEIHLAFVQSLCVPLCAALCTCLCLRPCVRAFVCGPVYVFRSNSLSSAAGRDKVDVASCNHYFVCAPEMSCTYFVSASSYDAIERTCNVVNYTVMVNFSHVVNNTCEKLTITDRPSI